MANLPWPPTTNRFTPRDAELTVYIQKTVESEEADSISPAGFVFILSDAEGREVDRVTTDEAGNAASQLSFDESFVGKTQQLTVHELDEGNSSIIYDETVLL